MNVRLKTTNGTRSIIEEYDKTSRIERIGKKIVITNGRGQFVPISHKQVEYLGVSLLKKNTARLKSKRSGMS